MGSVKVEIEKILFPNSYKKNMEKLKELKTALGKTDEEWMMCLGAGVSISAGLPNWYGLLAKVTAQLLPIASGIEGHTKIDPDFYGDVVEFYKNLKYEEGFLKKLEIGLEGGYENTFSNINVLEAAEYIKNYFEMTQGDRRPDKAGKSGTHTDYQLNCLVQKACKPSLEIKKGGEIENKTLGAVARLMKSDKDDLIHNVITYNYDNLLETYLREICGCEPDRVRSIVKDDEKRTGVFPDKENWNIYHVHGRIPCIDYPGEEMSDRIILTESNYYMEERINYSWTNIIQSYAILHANLIFIGFSGTDYNFRRIIRHVEKENANAYKRYIFFSVDGIAKAVLANDLKDGKSFEECIEKMQNNDPEYAYEKLFLNYLVEAQTRYWELYGLKVIWSSHGELCGHLESLHSYKNN